MCVANEQQNDISTSNSIFNQKEISIKVPLNVTWGELNNIKYLASGGSSNVYTAMFQGTPAIIKVLKPELADNEISMNQMESEISILSKLNHPHIVKLYGAGYNSKQRFIILEQLDGGTMDKIFDKNSKIIMKKNSLPLNDVLSNALAIANAMSYFHSALDGYTILHRDLKPDNIGFTSKGTLKVMDFGLASVIENATPFSDEVYEMSGGTGSLRYMAAEVADSRPYNHKADVYSFGILLWVLLSCEKPFVGYGIDEYYRRVVLEGERPDVDPKWPKELRELMTRCWDAKIDKRPNSKEIVSILESIKNTPTGKPTQRRRISGLNMKRRFMNKY